MGTLDWISVCLYISKPFYPFILSCLIISLFLLQKKKDPFECAYMCALHAHLCEILKHNFKNGLKFWQADSTPTTLQQIPAFSLENTYSWGSQSSCKPHEKWHAQCLAKSDRSYYLFICPIPYYQGPDRFKNSALPGLLKRDGLVLAVA